MATDMQKWIGRTARLEEQVRGLAGGPQLAKSSIEGGAIREYDETGNLSQVLGAQHDGTHTTVSVTGPKPPTPWFPAASAVPGVVEIRWNGKFAGGVLSPMDLKHVAAYAVPVGGVVDLSKQSGVMTGELGDSVQVQLDAGVYDVYLAAWSLSGKISDLAGPVSVVVAVPADADAIAEAIEDVQASANGKNKVTYSSHAPTSEDPGIFDDTWFVGQVGRPNDVVEATNLATNPKFQSLGEQLGGLGGGQQWGGVIQAGGSAQLSLINGWLKVTPSTSNDPTAYIIDTRYFDANRWQGKTFTVSATLRLDEALSGSINAEARRLNVGCISSGGVYNYNIGMSEQAPNQPGEYRLSVTATVPAGALAWFVRARSGSSVTPTYWTDVQVEEGSAASPYFDGDTESGTTDNESHYRWTGTPHASTSEKYLPALDIGESGNWNVIEQYRHDATGWVKVELSHYVFSSVDLGKATVGELDGIYIKGNSISGNQISGDAIDGMVITGAIIQSPGEGSGYQLTAGGYTAHDADGNVTVQLPTDGSPNQFKGDIEAESLTVSGTMSLQSSNNEVAAGAALTLASGVTSPNSPPTVGDSYVTTQFPTPPESANTVGLAYAAGLWWRAVDTFSNVNDRLEGLNAAGQVVVTYVWDYSARHGITAIGDEIFVLGPRNTRPNTERWVGVYKVTASSVTYQRGWQYGYYGTGTYQPAIGNDGTNVIIAQCWSDGHVSVRVFSKADGTRLNDMESTHVTATDYVGAYYGSADFGSPRFVLTRKNGIHDVYTPNGTVWPSESWNASGRSTVYGSTYTGGKFYDLTKQGELIEYTGFKWATDSNDWWVAATWTGPGGQETTAGPGKRFTFNRRSGIQANAGAAPVGVTGVKIYLASKALTPARADYHLIATAAGSSARVTNLPAGWATAANPPATNSFAGSGPGVIKSTTPHFRVDGNGAGKWGPLTFNADGTMSSSQVPAWVPITTWTAGYGPQTWGFVPAYRVWPDEKVEWRGVIAGDFGTGGGVDPLTIPAVARPMQPVNIPVATTASSSGTSSGVKRAEFSPVSAATKLRVYPGDTNGTWVSLEGIHYYKS